MFDTLFGAEMPLAVRFFLAFLVVLGLIGATRLGGAPIRRRPARRASTRGRQPRLAVIDYASVDGRRRLILVRRDNVEHLLMIGGPTDVVVEPNIVRAVAAPRDVPAPRPAAGIEALPRAIPLPENGTNGSWPLQPEPASGSRPSPRIEPCPMNCRAAVASRCRTASRARNAIRSRLWPTNCPHAHAAAPSPPRVRNRRRRAETAGRADTPRNRMNRLPKPAEPRLETRA